MQEFSGLNFADILRLPTEDEARSLILSRITVDADSGCWLWQGEKTSGGYGRLDIDGKHVRAHRLAYMAWRGDIPEGLFVCHHCDVPLCVRPSHLFTGTAQDNRDDCVRKGREAHMFGMDNSCSKLSEEDVVSMRLLYAQGHSQGALANRYGCTQRNVSRIVRGEKWPRAGGPTNNSRQRNGWGRKMEAEL